MAAVSMHQTTTVDDQLNQFTGSIHKKRTVYCLIQQPFGEFKLNAEKFCLKNFPFESKSKESKANNNKKLNRGKSVKPIFSYASDSEEK